MYKMDLKIIIIILLVTIVTAVKASVKNNCPAGAVFLSSNNNNNEIQPIKYYRIEFTYDCTELSLEKKLNQLKKKNEDPFVSYYLSDGINVKKNKRELEEGSGGNYDDDDDDSEDGDDDDDDSGEENELKPSENSILEEENRNDDDDSENEIIEKELTKVILIQPTPTISAIFEEERSTTTATEKSVSSIPSSVLSIEPTPSSTMNFYHSSLIKQDYYINIGSGDTPILSTPLVTMPQPPPLTPLNKPTIKNQKKLLPSGTPHTETIQDTCSQTTPTLHWIELITTPNNQTNLIALPSENQISDWEIILHCQKNNYEIYYSVRQRKISRNYNHKFKITFGSLHRSIQLLTQIITKITSNTTQNAIVTDYNLEIFPFYLTYVNESIVNEAVNSGSCPINSLKNTLTDLKKFLNVTLIENVEVKNVELLNPELTCDKKDFEFDKKNKEVNNEVNFPPSIKNQIDKIDGVVGIFLVYKVKEDFCYDPEDGPTPKLSLQLKNLKDYEKFPEDFWLQFDDKNQEIYGLPLEEDVGVVSGVVVCTDRGGKTSQDVLEIQIHPRRHPQNYHALFTLHFESAPFHPVLIRKFLTKLSSFLSNEIEVKSITESNNHVIFSFYNSSNPSTENEINLIRKILFSDEGGVVKEVKMGFSPEFNLTMSGGVVPIVSSGGGLGGNSGGGSSGGLGSSSGGGGSLLGGQSPIEHNTGGDKTDLFDFGENNSNEDDFINKIDNENNPNSGEDFFGGGGVVSGTYLTTYILPSVLIAIMILVAMIIACLLSRKKSYNSENSEFEEKKMLSKAGAPVIFQEELEHGQRQDQIRGQQQDQQRQVVTAGGVPPVVVMGLGSNNRPLPPRYNYQGGSGSGGSAQFGQAQQQGYAARGQQGQQQNMLGQQQQQRGFGGQSYQPPPALNYYNNSSSGRNHQPPPIYNPYNGNQQHQQRSGSHHHHYGGGGSAYVPP